MPAKRLCVFLVIAGVFVAACAASSATPNSAYYGGNENLATYGPVRPAVSAADYGGYVPNATGQPGAVATGAVPANASLVESQIVKTGTISIQVTALDDAILRATDQIHLMGGWLSGSDRTTSSSEAIASVTYRVPVDKFEDALAAMRKLGSKVISEHTESTPVGGQIVDLQARIENLRASEKAVQAIMAKATTIEEVLAVQQRLSDIQGQIEELSGQLAALTNQAAYSTLTVVFMVPISLTPSPSPSPSPTATPVPWSASDQADQAAGALGEVGKGLATLLIWLVVLVLPVTIGFVLVLVLLNWAMRVLDPLRKRLLPFTVAQPAAFAQPPMGQYPPMMPSSQYPPRSPVPPAAPVAPPAPAPRPRSRRKS